MKAIYRIAFVSLIVSCLVLVAMPRPAAAHPLGNFTVNQYSALTIAADRVDVFYVVDMAEIPAFQELGTIRPDHGTGLTPAEREAYASKKSAELLKGLVLSVDGQPRQLSVTRTDLSFPAGAGGLPTLRFEMGLTAPLAGGRKGTLDYKVENFAERIGWREIIAKPAEGISLERSSVPATDSSNALRSYNSNLLSSPLAITSASVAFAPGGAGKVTGGAAQGEGAGAAQGSSIGALSWAQGLADALTELISGKDLTLG